MIDQSKKIALIRKIRRIQHGTPSGKAREIVLSLNDYFDGDTSEYCTILANTNEPLSSQEFHRFLQGIAAKPEVSHVLIRFYDYDSALDYDDAWINSDTVFVCTAASTAEVENWFSAVQPSSVYEERDLEEFANLPTMPSSYGLIAVWWD
jgi:hypothetical protein